MNCEERSEGGGGGGVHERVLQKSHDSNNYDGKGDERKQKWVEKVAPPFNLEPAWCVFSQQRK